MRRFAGLDESIDILLQAGYAHQDYQRSAQAGDGIPVQRGGLSRFLVAGDDGKGRGDFAVSYGNSSQLRCCDG